MQTTWTIRGEIRASGFDFPAKMDDELEDQESALNYLENIHADSGCVVQEVVVKSWTTNPPKPLITSSLQQEASALHKLNPKTTMKLAQELYEKGHITYMRTDHAVLSDEAIDAAKEEVKKRYGEEYVGSLNPTKAKKSKKVAGAPAPVPEAQEAHEAIRPTHFDLYELPSSDDLGDLHKKVYNLIYRRAVQSVMAPATGKNRTATILMSADHDKFSWSARWRKTDFEGWQILGTPAKLDKEEDEEEEKEEETAWKKSQLLKKGMVLNWLNIQALPKRSRSSPRFTEATLVRELEKRGIGRPSTFASLVEVLFDKEYVEKKDLLGTKIFNSSLHIVPNTWPPLTQTEQITLGAEKQKIVPTTLGESVITFCLREFPQLFAYEFTNGMETRLDKISKGEEPWKMVCHDTWNSYKKDHERLQDKASLPSASEKVHDFGNGFKAVSSKSGLLLVQEGATKKDKTIFYTFPPDHTMQTITKEVATAWVQKQVADATYGSFNEKPILKKKGPYGEYLECSGLRIPFVDSDTAEMIVEKFKLRSQNHSTGYKFGPYTFSTGQYGPYMFKHDLKTKVFVSIPTTIDPKKLTAEEADTLYKNGVEAKKAKGSFRGGRGGRAAAGAARGGGGGRHAGGGRRRAAQARAQASS
jgi:DNA topoisomerase-1